MQIVKVNIRENNTRAVRKMEKSSLKDFIYGYCSHFSLYKATFLEIIIGNGKVQNRIGGRSVDILMRAIPFKTNGIVLF